MQGKAARLRRNGHCALRTSLKLRASACSQTCHRHVLLAQGSSAPVEDWALHLADQQQLAFLHESAQSALLSPSDNWSHLLGFAGAAGCAAPDSDSAGLAEASVITNSNGSAREPLCQRHGLQEASAPQRGSATQRGAGRRLSPPSQCSLNLSAAQDTSQVHWQRRLLSKGGGVRKAAGHGLCFHPALPSSVLTMAKSCQTPTLQRERLQESLCHVAGCPPPQRVLATSPALCLAGRRES